MDRASALLLVTPGDPLGVGAEVAVGGLLATGLPAILVGAAGPVLAEAARQGLQVEVVDRIVPGPGFRVLVPPPGPEPVEVRALRIAVAACLDGSASALVTGPIHKARLAAAGFPHPGHTEFLGELCGVPRPVMAFEGRSLRVALVTTHLPLARVSGALSVDRVLHVIRTAACALHDQLGVDEPRIAVCGVNPHAGDRGLLGSEDEAVIEPACVAARAGGIRVEGPVPAEAAMRWGVTGRADLVVAMYHDQGLVPLKVLDFGHAVNWTMGLPIIRTSVDHGTADDIAGRGLADPGSMAAALGLAWRLSVRRRAA